VSETCSTCRFWHGLGYEQPGECRQLPPRLVVVGETEETHYEVKTLFPTTPAGWWCGSHRLLDHLAALQGPCRDVTATTFRGGPGVVGDGTGVPGL